MKTILIVFFIFFLILSIATFPFKIRLMGYINLLNLVGVYSFKIAFLRILTGRIIYKNEKFEVENFANIIKDDFNQQYSKRLTNYFLKKIDIKKIEIYFKAGFADNSFSSAIICGSVSSFIQTFYSILSQKYYNIKLFEDIDATFNENNFEITFDSVFTISLFDLVISILKSIFYKKGEMVNER